MKYLILIGLIFTASFVNGQDSLNSYRIQKVHIKNSGMKILGSWAILNLVPGIIASNNTSGSQKYFYQMNTIWNSVNLGAAIIGLATITNNKNKSAIQEFKTQRQIEKLFLINAGLDLGYVTAGLYLHHRGSINNSDKLTGYGSSIILQGGFLFFFDGLMYKAENKNGRLLRAILKNNTLTFDGRQIGLHLNL